MSYPLDEDALTWLRRVAETLDVDPTGALEQAEPLLALVREVAHGVARPAGPMTLLLLGQASAAGGVSLADLTARLAALEPGSTV